MPLISLVYASLAARKFTTEEVKDILDISRRNNAQADVTGMLLYRDRFFIQALEGEQSVVHPLYRKISKDPRHRNVFTIVEREIDERIFANWTMGFNEIDDASVNEFEGFTDFLQSDKDLSFFVSKPDATARLLNTFRTRSKL